MRLIDAGKFEEFIRKKYADSEKAEDIKEQMLFDLSYQPTAYNPDKVVEQLEKLKKVEQDRSDDCDENGCGDAEQIFDDGRSQGRFEAFAKAIAIVKGGGVNG